MTDREKALELYRMRMAESSGFRVPYASDLAGFLKDRLHDLARTQAQIERARHQPRLYYATEVDDDQLTLMAQGITGLQTRFESMLQEVLTA